MKPVSHRIKSKVTFVERGKVKIGTYHLNSTAQALRTLRNIKALQTKGKVRAGPITQER